MSAVGWIFAITITLGIMLGISAFLYLIFGGTSSSNTAPQAETAFDPNIPTPEDKLLLLGLSKGSGNSWCIGTYYAMRFVDPKTGHYGMMGPWNPDAVISSPTTPPSSPLPPGGTCGGNFAKIGLNPSANQLQYYTFNSPYVINIHRQVGILDPTKDGDIIGALFQVSVEAGGKQFHYGYFDGNNPANTTNCPTGNNGCP